MKILDLLNKVLGEKTGNKTPMDNATEEAFAAGLTDISNKIKQLGATIDNTNEKLNAAKKKGLNKNILDRYEKELIDLEFEVNDQEKMLQKVIQSMQAKYQLSTEEVKNLERAVKNHSENIQDSTESFISSFSDLDSALSNGGKGVINYAKGWLSEMNIIGELMAEALNQMVDLNRIMVQFNRNLSLGLSSANVLGYDLYGNSMRGSINTLTAENYISKEEFLSVFQAFNKGNVLGASRNTDTNQNLQFGVNTAQLSKFYGVDMGTLNGLTSNLIYNYGKNVKDLNKIFEDGKEAAFGAGVSVKGYFDKLKEATDQLGEHYIAGGVTGLQNLALYAAKTDQSISSIIKTTDRLGDFSTQYQKQNQAAALGLENLARNSAKIWALGFNGQFARANAIQNDAAVKDLINNGMIDQNNNINAVGLKSLQSAGLDKEQIQTITRLIHAQKELGITAEQLLEPQKQSLEIRKKINQFERENLTVGEKIDAMWQRLKGAVIDPLANLLSPVFDTILDVSRLILDVIVPPLKIFGSMLSQLGDVLRGVYNLISPIFDYIHDASMQFSKWFDETSTHFGFLTKAVMSLGGAMLAFAGFQVFKGGLGNLGGTIGSLFGGGGAAATSGGGNILSNILGFGGLPSSRLLPGGMAGGATILKSSGLGIIGALASQAAGDAVGGKAGATLSSIGSWASSGAALGSIFPGVGTAVGAAIGGIAGLVADSWGDIAKVWTDGSGNLFTNIGETFEALGSHLLDMFKGIGNTIAGWFEDEDEKKKDQMDVGSQMASNWISNTDRINDILNSRQQSHAYVAEAAQEQKLKEIYQPVVNVQVKSSFDGGVQTRIQNR